MTSVPIAHTTILDEFQDHIQIQLNKRILFSGPFGAGKSFFLKTFFTKSNQYKSVTLSPVDYSITATGDIFELIKHDLLKELVQHFEQEIDLEREDFPLVLLVQTYLKDRFAFYDFVKPFVKVLYPGAGEAMEIAEQIPDTLSAFEKYKAQMNVDEEKVLINYLSEQSFKKGSIRESDGMTALIRDLINRVKTVINDQELVLVIDDLDRLDPEHVFRIINIFSAHHNSQTEENKFGFDKIIFVCDVENIRYMFEHRFGKNVDFAGYLDKFYSVEVFSFNFRLHLKESAVTLISNKENMGRYFKAGAIDSQIANLYRLKPIGQPFAKIFFMILDDLIDADLIRIRNFERFQSYSIPNYSQTLSGGYIYDSFNHPFLVLVHLLHHFFPTYEDLGLVLKNLSARFVSDYSFRGKNSANHYHQVLACYGLPFMLNDSQFANFSNSWDEQLAIAYNEHDRPFEFIFKRQDDGNISVVAIVEKESPREPVNQPLKLNPYHFFYQSFLTHFKKGGFSHLKKNF